VKPTIKYFTLQEVAERLSDVNDALLSPVSYEEVMQLMREKEWLMKAEHQLRCGMTVAREEMR
jgi:hypothetical protein